MKKPGMIDHIGAGLKYRIPPCCIANYIWDIFIGKIRHIEGSYHIKRGVIRLVINWNEEAKAKQWIPCLIHRKLDPRAMSDEEDKKILGEYHD